MASQFYNNFSQQPQHQPYYSYDRDRELPQPPYSSQRSLKPSVSPFEAPFDDHVYPARSQESFSQEPAYHGHTSERQQRPTSGFQPAIPLQDQGRKNYQPYQDTDHVYDAAEVGMTPGFEDGKKKRRVMGMFNFSEGKTAWVVWFFTIIQVSVFIAELVKMGKYLRSDKYHTLTYLAGTLTGSPIMTKPSFNPMIGPSPSVLINMGSRYVPCMHDIPGIQDSTIPIQWPCPNTTSSDVNDPSNSCSLSELCGFGGVPNPGAPNPSGAQPNQWFRFILPMFLHAGIIHIGFNMLLQLTLARDMEKEIGPARFFLVYVSSGIFGFVLGGNFAATGISSTGASGALFGIIALTLLDLLYKWKSRVSPWKDLAFIGLDVVISFVLGLLPGLDNFSHIGGFLMGLVLGICILRSPTALRRRIGADEPPYTPVRLARANDGEGDDAGIRAFIRSPIGFFKGRKSAWWAWWLLRVGALIAVVIVFILLLNNFYVYRVTCGWCKYLSCLVSYTFLVTNSVLTRAQPINGWCDIGNLQITNLTTKRSVFDSWDSMAKLYEVI